MFSSQQGPSAGDETSLLDRLAGRRLVVVTGKGGTGKTTVAAALGVAAADRGLRTLLIETGGARGLARLLGHDSARYRVLALGGSLHLLSMNPHAALEDYVVRQLKLRSLYRLVFRNRFIGPFMDAVPGLPDIIQLGKIWDLTQERSEGRPHWDLLILDAPATGHGLTMLGSPRNMMEVTRSGPFHANAERVHRLVADPAHTAIVLTALPEPLPVNEILQLYRKLGSSREQVAACVLNQVHPPPFEALGAWADARRQLQAGADEALSEALELTEHWVAQARRQQRAMERLREQLPAPILTMPYRIGRALGAEDIRALAKTFGSQPRVAP
jgi:anion-transporting  ArsA/GET3 family ATPase